MLDVLAELEVVPASRSAERLQQFYTSHRDIVATFYSTPTRDFPLGNVAYALKNRGVELDRPAIVPFGERQDLHAKLGVGTRDGRREGYVTTMNFSATSLAGFSPPPKAERLKGSQRFHYERTVLIRDPAQVAYLEQGIRRLAYGQEHFTSGPFFFGSDIVAELVSKLDQAEPGTPVTVTSPTLTDPVVIAALRRAAHRGAKVTVYTGHPASRLSDLRLPTDNLDKLASSGVQVFTPSPDDPLLLHAKQVAIGSTAYIGSSNLSERSRQGRSVDVMYRISSTDLHTVIHQELSALELQPYVASSPGPVEKRLSELGWDRRLVDLGLEPLFFRPPANPLARFRLVALPSGLGDLERYLRNQPMEFTPYSDSWVAATGTPPPSTLIAMDKALSTPSLGERLNRTLGFEVYRRHGGVIGNVAGLVGRWTDEIISPSTEPRRGGWVAYQRQQDKEREPGPVEKLLRALVWNAQSVSLAIATYIGLQLPLARVASTLLDASAQFALGFEHRQVADKDSLSYTVRRLFRIVFFGEDWARRLEYVTDTDSPGEYRKRIRELHTLAYRQRDATTQFLDSMGELPPRSRATGLDQVPPVPFHESGLIGVIQARRRFDRAVFERFLPLLLSMNPYEPGSQAYQDYLKAVANLRDAVGPDPKWLSDPKYSLERTKWYSKNPYFEIRLDLDYVKGEVKIRGLGEEYSRGIARAADELAKLLPADLTRWVPALRRGRPPFDPKTMPSLRSLFSFEEAYDVVSNLYGTVRQTLTTPNYLHHLQQAWAKSAELRQVVRTAGPKSPALETAGKQLNELVQRLPALKAAPHALARVPASDTRIAGVPTRYAMSLVGAIGIGLVVDRVVDALVLGEQGPDLPTQLAAAATLGDLRSVDLTPRTAPLASLALGVGAATAAGFLFPQYVQLDQAPNVGVLRFNTRAAAIAGLLAPLVVRGLAALLIKPIELLPRVAHAVRRLADPNLPEQDLPAKPEPLGAILSSRLARLVAENPQADPVLRSLLVRLGRDLLEDAPSDAFSATTIAQQTTTPILQLPFVVRLQGQQAMLSFGLQGPPMLGFGFTPFLPFALSVPSSRAWWNQPLSRRERYDRDLPPEQRRPWLRSLEAFLEFRWGDALRPLLDPEALFGPPDEEGWRDLNLFQYFWREGLVSLAQWGSALIPLRHLHYTPGSTFEEGAKFVGTLGLITLAASLLGRRKQIPPLLRGAGNAVLGLLGLPFEAGRAMFAGTQAVLQPLLSRLRAEQILRPATTVQPLNRNALLRLGGVSGGLALGWYMTQPDRPGWMRFAGGVLLSSSLYQAVRQTAFEKDAEKNLVVAAKPLVDRASTLLGLLGEQAKKLPWKKLAYATALLSVGMKLTDPETGLWAGEPYLDPSTRIQGALGVSLLLGGAFSLAGVTDQQSLARGRLARRFLENLGVPAKQRRAVAAVVAGAWRRPKLETLPDPNFDKQLLHVQRQTKNILSTRLSRAATAYTAVVLAAKFLAHTVDLDFLYNIPILGPAIRVLAGVEHRRDLDRLILSSPGVKRSREPGGLVGFVQDVAHQISPLRLAEFLGAYQDSPEPFLSLGNLGASFRAKGVQPIRTKGFVQYASPISDLSLSAYDLVTAGLDKSELRRRLAAAAYEAQTPEGVWRQLAFGAVRREAIQLSPLRVFPQTSPGLARELAMRRAKARTLSWKTHGEIALTLRQEGLLSGAIQDELVARPRSYDPLAFLEHAEIAIFASDNRKGGLGLLSTFVPDLHSVDDVRQYNEEDQPGAGGPVFAHPLDYFQKLSQRISRIPIIGQLLSLTEVLIRSSVVAAVGGAALVALTHFDAFVESYQASRSPLAQALENNKQGLFRSANVFISEGEEIIALDLRSNRVIDIDLPQAFRELNLDTQGRSIVEEWAKRLNVSYKSLDLSLRNWLAVDVFGRKGLQLKKVELKKLSADELIPNFRSRRKHIQQQLDEILDQRVFNSIVQTDAQLSSAPSLFTFIYSKQGLSPDEWRAHVRLLSNRMLDELEQIALEVVKSTPNATRVELTNLIAQRLEKTSAFRKFRNTFEFPVLPARTRRSFQAKRGISFLQALDAATQRPDDEVLRRGLEEFDELLAEGDLKQRAVLAETRRRLLSPQQILNRGLGLSLSLYTTMTYEVPLLYQGLEALAFLAAADRRREQAGRAFAEAVVHGSLSAGVSVLTGAAIGAVASLSLPAWASIAIGSLAVAGLSVAGSAIYQASAPVRRAFRPLAEAFDASLSAAGRVFANPGEALAAALDPFFLGTPVRWLSAGLDFVTRPARKLLGGAVLSVLQPIGRYVANLRRDLEQEGGVKYLLLEPFLPKTLFQPTYEPGRKTWYGREPWDYGDARGAAQQQFIEALTRASYLDINLSFLHPELLGQPTGFLQEVRWQRQFSSAGVVGGRVLDPFNLRSSPEFLPSTLLLTVLRSRQLAYETHILGGQWVRAIEQAEARRRMAKTFGIPLLVLSAAAAYGLNKAWEWGWDYYRNNFAEPSPPSKAPPSAPPSPPSDTPSSTSPTPPTSGGDSPDTRLHAPIGDITSSGSATRPSPVLERFYAELGMPVPVEVRGKDGAFYNVEARRVEIGEEIEAAVASYSRLAQPARTRIDFLLAHEAAHHYDLLDGGARLQAKIDAGLRKVFDALPEKERLIIGDLTERSVLLYAAEQGIDVGLPDWEARLTQAQRVQIQSVRAAELSANLAAAEVVKARGGRLEDLVSERLSLGAIQQAQASVSGRLPFRSSEELLDELDTLLTQRPQVGTQLGGIYVTERGTLVKVSRTDPEDIGRLLNEVEVTRLAGEAGVGPRVLAVATRPDKGNRVLVAFEMERAPGRQLQEYLQRPVAPDKVIALDRRLAQLQGLIDQAVVQSYDATQHLHKDLHPDNIFVFGDKITIIDYGEAVSAPGFGPRRVLLEEAGVSTPSYSYLYRGQINQARSRLANMPVQFVLSPSPFGQPPVTQPTIPGGFPYIPNSLVVDPQLRGLQVYLGDEGLAISPEAAQRFDTDPQVRLAVHRVVADVVGVQNVDPRLKPLAERLATESILADLRARGWAAETKADLQAYVSVRGKQDLAERYKLETQRFAAALQMSSLSGDTPDVASIRLVQPSLQERAALLLQDLGFQPLPIELIPDQAQAVIEYVPERRVVRVSQAAATALADLDRLPREVRQQIVQAWASVGYLSTGTQPGDVPEAVAKTLRSRGFRTQEWLPLGSIAEARGDIAAGRLASTVRVGRLRRYTDEVPGAIGGFVRRLASFFDPVDLPRPTKRPPIPFSIEHRLRVEKKFAIWKNRLSPILPKKIFGVDSEMTIRTFIRGDFNPSYRNNMGILYDAYDKLFFRRARNLPLHTLIMLRQIEGVSPEDMGMHGLLKDYRLASRMSGLRSFMASELTDTAKSYLPFMNLLTFLDSIGLGIQHVAWQVRRLYENIDVRVRRLGFSGGLSDLLNPTFTFLDTFFTAQDLNTYKQAVLTGGSYEALLQARNNMMSNLYITSIGELTGSATPGVVWGLLASSLTAFFAKNQMDLPFGIQLFGPEGLIKKTGYLPIYERMAAEDTALIKRGIAPIAPIQSASALVKLHAEAPYVRGMLYETFEPVRYGLSWLSEKTQNLLGMIFDPLLRFALWAGSGLAYLTASLTSAMVVVASKLAAFTTRLATRATAFVTTSLFRSPLATLGATSLGLVGLSSFLTRDYTRLPDGTVVDRQGRVVTGIPRLLFEVNRAAWTISAGSFSLLAAGLLVNSLGWANAIRASYGITAAYAALNQDGSPINAFLLGYSASMALQHSPNALAFGRSNLFALLPGLAAAAFANDLRRGSNALVSGGALATALYMSAFSPQSLYTLPLGRAWLGGLVGGAIAKAAGREENTYLAFLVGAGTGLLSPRLTRPGRLAGLGVFLGLTTYDYERKQLTTNKLIANAALGTALVLASEPQLSREVGQQAARAIAQTSSWLGDVGLRLGGALSSVPRHLLNTLGRLGSALYQGAWSWLTGTLFLSRQLLSHSFLFLSQTARRFGITPFITRHLIPGIRRFGTELGTLLYQGARSNLRSLTRISSTLALGYLAQRDLLEGRTSDFVVSASLAATFASLDSPQSLHRLIGTSYGRAWLAALAAGVLHRQREPDAELNKRLGVMALQGSAVLAAEGLISWGRRRFPSLVQRLRQGIVGFLQWPRLLKERLVNYLSSLPELNLENLQRWGLAAYRGVRSAIGRAVSSTTRLAQQTYDLVSRNIGSAFRIGSTLAFAYLAQKDLLEGKTSDFVVSTSLAFTAASLDSPQAVQRLFGTRYGRAWLWALAVGAFHRQMEPDAELNERLGIMALHGTAALAVDSFLPWAWRRLPRLTRAFGTTFRRLRTLGAGILGGARSLLLRLGDIALIGARAATRAVTRSVGAAASALSWLASRSLSGLGWLTSRSLSGLGWLATRSISGLAWLTTRSLQITGQLGLTLLRKGGDLAARIPQLLRHSYTGLRFAGVLGAGYLAQQDLLTGRTSDFIVTGSAALTLAALDSPQRLLSFLSRRSGRAWTAALLAGMYDRRRDPDALLNKRLGVMALAASAVLGTEELLGWIRRHPITFTRLGAAGVATWLAYDDWRRRDYGGLFVSASLGSAALFLGSPQRLRAVLRTRLGRAWVGATLMGAWERHRSGESLTWRTGAAAAVAAFTPDLLQAAQRRPLTALRLGAAAFAAYRASQSTPYEGVFYGSLGAMLLLNRLPWRSRLGRALLGATAVGLLDRRDDATGLVHSVLAGLAVGYGPDLLLGAGRWASRRPVLAGRLLVSQLALAKTILAAKKGQTFDALAYGSLTAAATFIDSPARARAVLRSRLGRAWLAATAYGLYDSEPSWRGVSLAAAAAFAPDLVSYGFSGKARPTRILAPLILLGAGLTQKEEDKPTRMLAYSALAGSVLLGGEYDHILPWLQRAGAIGGMVAGGVQQLARWALGTHAGRSLGLGAGVALLALNWQNLSPEMRVQALAALGAGVALEALSYRQVRNFVAGLYGPDVGSQFVARGAFSSISDIASGTLDLYTTWRGLKRMAEAKHTLEYQMGAMEASGAAASLFASAGSMGAEGGAGGSLAATFISQTLAPYLARRRAILRYQYRKPDPLFAVEDTLYTARVGAISQGLGEAITVGLRSSDALAFGGTVAGLLAVSAALRLDPDANTEFITLGPLALNPIDITVAAAVGGKALHRFSRWAATRQVAQQALPWYSKAAHRVVDWVAQIPQTGATKLQEAVGEAASRLTSLQASPANKVLAIAGSRQRAAELLESIGAGNLIQQLDDPTDEVIQALARARGQEVLTRGGGAIRAIGKGVGKVLQVIGPVIDLTSAAVGHAETGQARNLVGSQAQMFRRGLHRRLSGSAGAAGSFAGWATANPFVAAGASLVSAAIGGAAAEDIYARATRYGIFPEDIHRGMNVGGAVGLGIGLAGAAAVAAAVVTGVIALPALALIGLVGLVAAGVTALWSAGQYIGARVAIERERERRWRAQGLDVREQRRLERRREQERTHKRLRQQAQEVYRPLRDPKVYEQYQELQQFKRRLQQHQELMERYEKQHQPEAQPTPGYNPRKRRMWTVAQLSRKRQEAQQQVQQLAQSYSYVLDPAKEILDKQAPRPEEEQRVQIQQQQEQRQPSWIERLWGTVKGFFGRLVGGSARAAPRQQPETPLTFTPTSSDPGASIEGVDPRIRRTALGGLNRNLDAVLMAIRAVEASGDYNVRSTSHAHTGWRVDQGPYQEGYFDHYLAIGARRLGVDPSQLTREQQYDVAAIGRLHEKGLIERIESADLSDPEQRLAIAESVAKAWGSAYAHQPEYHRHYAHLIGEANRAQQILAQNQAQQGEAPSRLDNGKFVSAIRGRTLDEMLAYRPSESQGFYGRRARGRQHSKVDFDARVGAGQGAVIQAMEAGRATYVPWTSNSGMVRVETKDSRGRTIVYEYGHLSLESIRRTFGDKKVIDVQAGQQLGTVTMDSISSAPHLDLGIKVDGRYVDPQQYIRERMALEAAQQAAQPQVQATDPAVTAEVEMAKQVADEVIKAAEEKVNEAVARRPRRVRVHKAQSPVPTARADSAAVPIKNGRSPEIEWTGPLQGVMRHAVHDDDRVVTKANDTARVADPIARAETALR